MGILRAAAALALTLTAALPGTAGAATSGWRHSSDAGLAYDSNPANIRHGAAERPSAFVAAGVGSERSFHLSGSSALLWRLKLGGEAYERQDRLSQLRGSSLLRLSFQWDEGFYAPLLAVWASAGYADYGSRIRDGVDYRAGLYVQERLTTAISLRAGGHWSGRHAEGQAFDLGGSSGTMHLDWAPTAAANLYGDYQYYDGDLVSTNLSSPGAIAAASAIDRDDAFSEGALSQYAYRLDAYAHLGTLGFNYALSPRYALDLQLQSVLARANTGYRYRREFSTLSVLLRF